jgi:hypothetical protein
MIVPNVRVLGFGVSMNGYARLKDGHCFSSPIERLKHKPAVGNKRGHRSDHKPIKSAGRYLL